MEVVGFETCVESVLGPGAAATALGFQDDDVLCWVEFYVCFGGRQSEPA